MKSTKAQRNQAVTDLARTLFQEVDHYQNQIVSCSATIVASSPTTIKARWSAKVLLDVDRTSKGNLDGIVLADSLVYEECTICLSWKTAEACAALSEGCDFTWDDFVISDAIAWDALTPREIRSALEREDEIALGEQLLERWGSAGDVNYTQYPRRLRAYLSGCVEAVRKFERRSPRKLRRRSS